MKVALLTMLFEDAMAIGSSLDIDYDPRCMDLASPAGFLLPGFDFGASICLIV